MALIGKKTVFHVTHERQLLGGHHLSLSPPSPRKAEEGRGLWWEGPCQALDKLKWEPNSTHWPWNVEVLLLEGGHFEREKDELCEE